MPREAIRRETGRDIEDEGDMAWVEDMRFVEDAARRWRTDFVNRACGSDGNGWRRGELASLRGLVRDCGRVRERRRLVLDCGGGGDLNAVVVEVDEDSVGGGLDEVNAGAGAGSEIGCGGCSAGPIDASISFEIAC